MKKIMDILIDYILIIGLGISGLLFIMAHQYFVISGISLVLFIYLTVLKIKKERII